MATDHNASTRRAQSRTLLEANAWGEPWAGFELDLVREFGEDTAEDLATALGRTVYAVQSIREAIRRGEPVGGGNRPTPRPQPAYTFIGSDVPPGWLD